jgi:hypothetical protein
LTRRKGRDLGELVRPHLQRRGGRRCRVSRTRPDGGAANRIRHVVKPVPAGARRAPYAFIQARTRVTNAVAALFGRPSTDSGLRPPLLSMLTESQIRPR